MTPAGGSEGGPRRPGDGAAPTGHDGGPEWLAREVDGWVRDGLIRAEQAEWLRGRYGLAEGETPRSWKRLQVVKVLAALGAALIGVGVLVTVGANWEAIPRFARLAMLLAATGGAYATGYGLAHGARARPALGMALLLLGSLLWGSSIFLIAQMYHLGGDGGEATALLYWFAGVLPLAYVLRSRLHLALAVAIGSVWLGMSMTAPPPWEGPSVLVFLLALGALLLAVGMLHRGSGPCADFAGIYGAFGWLAALIGLYGLSFQIGDDGSEPARQAVAWTVGALALAVAAAAVLLMRRERSDRAAAWEALGVLAVAAVAAVMLLIGPASYADHDGIVLRAVVFNVLLLAAAVAAIGIGWERLQPRLVDLGLLVFSVQLMTRYFDLLGPMLPGGLAFIVAGLILLGGGAFLERQRRQVVDSMARR